MPRYFFQFHDVDQTVDDMGVELPDIATARLLATRLAGAVLCEEAERFIEAKDWHLDITDDAGLILFSLRFAVVDGSGTIT